MSKLAIASRVMSSGLFAALAVGVVGSAVGCSKPEEEKKQAWSCARDEVPMGEVIRCTSSAITSDGPAAGGTTDGTGTTTDGTQYPTTTDGTTSDGTTPDGTTDGTGGGGADGTTTYECFPGSDNPDCPPADTNGGTTDGTPGGTTGGTSDGTTDGTTNGGTTSGGTSGDTPGNSSGGGASGNGGGGSNGNSSGGHTTDGTGPGNSSGGGGGNGGGTSHEPGCDECVYVPDLPYCGGSGSGTSDGTTTSGGTTSGGTDCGKPNCAPPGQTKKDGTTDGTGASSSSSGSDGASSSGGGSGGGNNGHHYDCTKDKKGNKTCVSTPDCAPGTHPSACGACVSDSDGPADCVPPTEGGCWVTGGGFIEGASIVPAAPADGHDNFGGNAKPMKRGDVSGHWNHVDHGTGNHAKGRPEYIMCRTTDGPGPGQPGGKKGLVANQVYFGGHAQWRVAADAVWSDGYWFDVVAEDHGEPGNTSALKNGQMPDSYHFTLRKMDDPTAAVSGAIVYETRGDLTGGNIQLHPSNNGHPAVSSPLPTWVSIEQ
jgi:hypothetical protein